jgi:hypothetical protein
MGAIAADWWATAGLQLRSSKRRGAATCRALSDSHSQKERPTHLHHMHLPRELLQAPLGSPRLPLCRCRCFCQVSSLPLGLGHSHALNALALRHPPLQQAGRQAGRVGNPTACQNSGGKAPRSAGNAHPHCKIPCHLPCLPGMHPQPPSNKSPHLPNLLP